MENYTTKSPNELGEWLVGLAIKKIDSWAEHNLNHIIHREKKPICLQIGKNTWLIGGFTVTEQKNIGWKVEKNNELVHVFSSKRAAFLYCVLEKLKYYGLSRDILTNDQEYSRLLSEKIYYTEKISRKREKDLFKRSLWNAKLSDASAKLDSIRKELEKNFISAKYIKVWD